jgi:hypothetical protein
MAFCKRGMVQSLQGFPQDRGCKHVPNELPVGTLGPTPEACLTPTPNA